MPFAFAPILHYTTVYEMSSFFSSLCSHLFFFLVIRSCSTFSSFLFLFHFFFSLSLFSLFSLLAATSCPPEYINTTYYTETLGPSSPVHNTSFSKAEGYRLGTLLSRALFHMTSTNIVLLFVEAGKPVIFAVVGPRTVGTGRARGRRDTLFLRQT